MNTIKTIRNRLNRVLDIEADITKRELDRFREKQRDVEEWCGVGGFYSRYEKCINARNEHLDDLEQLRSNIGRAVFHDTLTVYPYFCRDCVLEILLRSDISKQTFMGDTVDCPVCGRPLTRSARRKTFQIIRGSEQVKSNY